MACGVLGCARSELADRNQLARIRGAMKEVNLTLGNDAPVTQSAMRQGSAPRFVSLERSERGRRPVPQEPGTKSRDPAMTWTVGVATGAA